MTVYHTTDLQYRAMNNESSFALALKSFMQQPANAGSYAPQIGAISGVQQQAQGQKKALEQQAMQHFMVYQQKSAEDDMMLKQLKHNFSGAAGQAALHGVPAEERQG